MNGGGSIVQRITGWCFSLLLAMVALYCAVKVLESIWPALLLIVGIVALLVIIWKLVVHFTTTNYW